MAVAAYSAAPEASSIRYSLGCLSGGERVAGLCFAVYLYKYYCVGKSLANIFPVIPNSKRASL